MVLDRAGGFRGMPLAEVVPQDGNVVEGVGHFFGVCAWVGGVGGVLEVGFVGKGVLLGVSEIEETEEDGSLGEKENGVAVVVVMVYVYRIWGIL